MFPRVQSIEAAAAAGQLLSPVWSPDGRSIAFLSDRLKLEEPWLSFRLFVMRVDRGEPSARAIASFSDGSSLSWRR